MANMVKKMFDNRTPKSLAYIIRFAVLFLFQNVTISFASPNKMTSNVQIKSYLHEGANWAPMKPKMTNVLMVYLTNNPSVNASVTFALRRVCDAPTMSKSPFPWGLRRVTLRSSYGFTGIVASTILFNSAQ